MDVSYHNKINYYTIMVSGLKKPACDLEFLYIYSLLMLLKCAIIALTQKISSVFYTNITDVHDNNKV